MPNKKSDSGEMFTIIFVDAVNFTNELKKYGRDTVSLKINQLKEYVEFFFVYKLKGKIINEMGDGFLILCPPKPAEVINEAIACQSFIDAYNHKKESPNTLNARMAIHFGLVSAPDGKNYIDTNLNLAARLEGVTPSGCICISEVLYQIINDALREYSFDELESEFKGLGQNKYYIVKSPNDNGTELTKSESRLDFYFSTSAAFKKANSFQPAKETLIQGLVDFPDNPEITYQLADVEYRLENYKEAISIYDKCIQLNYKTADSYLYQAYGYKALNDDDKAVSCALNSIEANPKRFHAMGLIAGVRLSENNYSEADYWSKEALKHAPTFIFAIVFLIIISLIKDEKDSVEELILRIEPSRRDHLISSTLKYLTYMKQGKYKEKLISIVEGLEISETEKISKRNNRELLLNRKPQNSRNRK